MSKEKANELVEKFKPHADWNNEYGSQEEKSNTKHAIQCAIIAVDEIITSYPKHPSKIGSLMPFTEAHRFWQEVKQHLEEML